MSRANKRVQSSSVVDLKQIIFTVVGILLGASVIFIAGMQAGQHLGEPLERIGASLSASMKSEAPETENKPKKIAPATAFAFYNDLYAPAEPVKRRKMRMPRGNANNPEGKPSRVRKGKKHKFAHAKTHKLKRKPSVQKKVLARKARGASKGAPPARLGDSLHNVDISQEGLGAARVVRRVKQAPAQPMTHKTSAALPIPAKLTIPKQTAPAKDAARYRVLSATKKP